MIPPEIIDRIRDAVPLADHIARTVALKRSGTQLKGLCPFHNERTPSFYVYPGENRYHCFGCGKHGDIFSWMQEIEGFSFLDAVERLSAQTGIAVPKEGPPDTHYQEKIQPLLRVNEEALKYYVHNLTVNPAGKGAQAYLIDRGVHADSITRFRLGYALPQWEGLARYLQSRSFRPQLLQEAGLARPGKQQGSLYDYFRDRVIFPILSEKGDCIAFGGRLMEAGEPKYLNTPENAVFQKREVLYGFSFAKQEIRKADLVYIVEGYLDVIGMHQSSFANTVAPLGTSFTREHLEKLKKVTGNFVLVFDGDAAGRKAVFRVAGMLMDAGVRSRVVLLPEGTDAFDLTRTGDRNRAARKLQAAIPLSDFVLNHLYLEILQGRGGRISTVEDKLRYLGAVEEFLAGATDMTMARLMIRQAAVLTGSDPEAALRDFSAKKERNQIKIPTPAVPETKFAPQAPPAKDASFELYLLRLVFLHEELWPALEQVLASGELVLEHSGALYLYQIIRTFMQAGTVPGREERIARVGDRQLADALAGDLAGGHFEMDHKTQFLDTVKTVRLRQLAARRRALSSEVNRLVVAGEKARAMELEQKILEIRKTEESILQSGK